MSQVRSVTHLSGPDTGLRGDLSGAVGAVPVEAGKCRFTLTEEEDRYAKAWKEYRRVDEVAHERNI
jgi:hypothetical protein